MSYLLNLETSSTNCSVCLSENEQVVALKEDNSSGFSHAEKLHVYINDVLQQSGIKRRQLDAVAVGEGPGSYTGLRIGVAAAKGLCYALSIPLIAVNSLEALALQVHKKDCYIVPMMDARRMEVYDSVLYNGIVLQQTRAVIVDETIYRTMIKPENEVRFLGNGVFKSKEFLLFPKADFFENLVPTAKTIAPLAYAKFQEKDFEDVAYFDPLYLKDFKINNIPKTKIK